jgi:hypothetical protein
MVAQAAKIDQTTPHVPKQKSTSIALDPSPAVKKVCLAKFMAIPTTPMLAKFMAIPHHTYLIMKMPTANRFLSVLGDIMVSYNCESATVELSKNSVIKAATTVMVAQAAKIDQTTLQVPEQKHTTTALDPSPAAKKICLGLPDTSKEVVIGADLDPK